MTRFVDGPAQGQTLMLKTAPQLLRVTCAPGPHADSDPTWDALDRTEDRPQPREALYAYVRVGGSGMCHIMAGKNSGFYSISDYRFAKAQPDDQTMRDETLWRAWCASYTPL